MADKSKIRGRVGRPAKTELRTRWSITLPVSVTDPWETLLNDPKTNKPMVGERQLIFAEILRLLMAAWRKKESTIQVQHLLRRMDKLVDPLDFK